MKKQLVLAIVAACGGGDDPLSNDAPLPIDARPDALVPCPFSGDCPGGEPGVNAPDGGEIRIENLIFPDGSARTLTTAYFLRAQAGDPTPQPFPNVVDNAVLHCNTWDDRIYPFGDASATLGAPATYAPGGREYKNVGATITLQELSGATAAFELVGYENFITPFLGGAFHEFTYNPDVELGDPYFAIGADLVGGSGDIAGGYKLKVIIPGGPDLAAPHVFDFSDERHRGIEVPPRPVLADFATLGVPSALDIRRSEPFTREWTVPVQAPIDLLTMVTVFDTVGDAFHLTKLCVSAKPGKITITTEDLATMPDRGVLFVAHLLHRTTTFDNIRRNDMVGVAATATAFTMVP